MSRSSAGPAPASQNTEPSASTVELMADELVGLIEDFEETISQGLVPSNFASRVSQIRQKVERLIDG